MKKLLIVSNDILGKTLEAVLYGYFDAIIVAIADEALERFLLEDPTHVLISDMTGSKGDKKLYEDLQGANVNSKIIRYGLDSQSDLRFPASVEEVLSMLSK